MNDLDPTRELFLERALDDAVTAWDRRGWPRPAAIVVSGSGLGVDLYPPGHGPEPLADLLPFPVHGIVGHPHRVELLLPPSGGPDRTDRAGRPVLYYRGRLHCYQGYTPGQAAFPIRLGALLGARTLVMTNAAGGLDPEVPAGSLVAVSDHLNLTGLSPLKGTLPEAWGARFPDMTEAYDRGLRNLAREHAAELGVTLGEGIYAGVPGPSYETPAEVRMLTMLGAKLVGMSTVLEVIAARHMGLRCLVLSLVANLGAGVVDDPLDHEEVVAAGAAASEKLIALLKALLEDDRLYGIVAS